MWTWIGIAFGAGIMVGGTAGAITMALLSMAGRTEAALHEPELKF